MRIRADPDPQHWTPVKIKYWYGIKKGRAEDPGKFKVLYNILVFFYI